MSAAARALATVHVDTETGFSGGEVQVLGLTRGLAARGVSVVVATPAGGELAPRAREHGLAVAELSAHNDFDLVYVARLARLLRRERADLVHLHTGRAAWLGGLAAALAGVPAIVTRRQDKRLDGSWKRALVYRSLAAASVGIAPLVAEQILATGAPRSRVTTIWSAVDPANLVPSAPRSQLRERLGLAASQFVIASAAQLVERKGLDVLVGALARQRTPRDVVALIAGDGPQRERLESLARTLPSGRSARLLGRVEHVADVLAAADAFVLPSRAEGLGVAALEAMALGLPVVASRVGGLAQAVADSGLLVTVGDESKLAAALDRVADDQELCQRLGAAGRARVQSTFLFETQVERYLALYARVVARDPSPADTLLPP